MNERIQTILNQTNISTFPLFPGQDPAWVATDYDMEKFTELIVKECLTMCVTTVGNADYNTGRMHCYNNIKEHFGVEL